MATKKAEYMNTNDFLAAAAAIQPRCASDSRVTNAVAKEEEEESEDEPVSQSLKHPIPKKVGQYEILGTVGEGAFSVVKLAHSPELKQYYACKVIERVRLKRNLEHRFECEIRVHQQMHHPGIVNLIDVLSDKNFFYVFLEFCPNGELFQHIVDAGKLDEEQAKPIIKQILEAMKYIHQMGVSHRDMKPENLLLDQVGHTKISDFGLSRFLDSDGKATTPCGSPCYASPECISGSPYDGRTSDCWSCGVIMYAMVTGQLPWTKRNQAQLFEQIRRGEYTIPKYLSQTCRSFISSLMCVDYKKRLTAAQALQHPFLAGVTVPIPSMLATNMPIISLKKIDVFFGLIDKDDEKDINVDEEIFRKNKESMYPINFEKSLREISGPVIKKRPIQRSERSRSSKSGRPSNAEGTKTSATVHSSLKISGQPTEQMATATKPKKTIPTTSSSARKVAEKPSSSKSQRPPNSNTSHAQNTSTKPKPPTRTTAPKRPVTKH